MEKVAVVTGASSGIGFAISKKLSQSGFKVYACSRSIDKPGIKSDSLEAVRLDVRDDQSVSDLMVFLGAKNERIDVLVNCAGLGVIGPAELLDWADIRNVFETNFFGVIRMCRHVIPVMRAQGGGHIINIGSIAGRMGLPFQSFYSASKYALEGFTEALRLEVEPFGIETTLILPGDFKTTINQNKKVFWGEKDGYYSPVSERVIKSINKDADSGGDPAEIGDLVSRILERKEGRLNILLGPAFQVFSCLMKPFIPIRIFKMIMKRHFRL